MPARAMKAPVVFLSSFYQEIALAEDRHDSALWQLRQRLWKENFDSDSEGSSAIWVAERSAPDLSIEKDKLEVVDQVVDVLLRSDIYICILADKRSGPIDHGSLIKVASRETATSYFEIELYAAAMYQKPVYLFILEGFDPGSRLKSLLKILSWALPDLAFCKPAGVDQIFAEIRNLLDRHKRDPLKQADPIRRRLVNGLYLKRGQHAPPGREADGVLFLGGVVEQRSALPQKDLVEHLISKCEEVQTMQRKLNRVWLAARELMAASYFPKDVQADNRLRDFLPLWNRTLSLWSSTAAWSGFHGHLYAGVIAPLNSQVQIRHQLAYRDRKKSSLDVWVMPYGGLASGHYSLAKLLPFGYRRFAILRRALKYIEWSMKDSETIGGTPTPGEYAVRGSIRLYLGNTFGCLADFKRMMRLRIKQGAQENELGSEFMHMGAGYAATGRLFKARADLERSVAILSANPVDPNLARAERHLAFVLALIGKKAAATQMREAARKHAANIGAMDQFR